MFVNWTEIMNIGNDWEEGLGDRPPEEISDYSPLPLLQASQGNITSSSTSDHVTRWEGLPLTGGESTVEGEEGPTVITETIREEEDSKDEPGGFHPMKMIKILIPHIILISMLLSYLTVGAVILQKLETRDEVNQRVAKLQRIREHMNVVVQKSWNLHLSKNVSQEKWRSSVREYLLNLSELHEDRPVRKELELLQNTTTRWTFPTALLYVLTVLTTCGYGEVDVNTNGGKIFAVAFALIGIPLMFITAADIGKFLSETLLRAISHMERCWRSFLWCCCRRRPSKTKSRDALEELVEGGEETLGESLLFPIGAYVSLICLYCSLGALLFTSFEKNWSFIHAFHFGFNLIVTVGLGDIVVKDGVFLCLIVAYVIIGLSVVTMCVDLASTHLKAYFTRIHYYGQARSRFLGMTEDVREMMQLLAAMRGKKGGKVTWNDLKDFLDSDQYRDRPFIPRDFNKLRWVDETSSAISTLRHNSVTSEVADSQSSLLRKPSSVRRSHRSSSDRDRDSKDRRSSHYHSHHHHDRPPNIPQVPSVIHEAAGLEATGLLHDCPDIS